MRLRHVVYLMTNAVIVGALIVFVLTMGWVGFVPVFGAIILGFALAWPCVDPGGEADQDTRTRPGTPRRTARPAPSTGTGSKAAATRCAPSRPTRSNPHRGPERAPVPDDMEPIWRAIWIPAHACHTPSCGP